MYSFHAWPQSYDHGGEGGRRRGEGRSTVQRLCVGRGVIISCIARSRMTTDPGIPTIPGRSTSGFHGSGRHHFHQRRSAIMCSASRVLRVWVASYCEGFGGKAGFLFFVAVTGGRVLLLGPAQTKWLKRTQPL